VAGGQERRGDGGARPSEEGDLDCTHQTWSTWSGWEVDVDEAKKWFFKVA